MFDHDGLLPEMLPATAENKERLRQWLAQIGPSGGTDPREALRLGLELLPSALFLLSDGDFKPEKNQGVLATDLSIPEVVDRSNLARAPIHTIAYEDTANRVSMQELAAQTGGHYRFVPAQRAASAAPPTREELAKRAAKLLAQARLVESRGFQRQAIGRYQRLLADYPDTPAAKEAELRARQLLATVNDKAGMLNTRGKTAIFGQNALPGK
jgi:hypothetical protein